MKGLLTLSQIKDKLARGEYELTLHALNRVVDRNISEAEIRKAGESAELIEDYPTDKYGPTCLLLGWSSGKRPLHIHVSKSENLMIKIITLYEPSGEEWENFRTRRTKQ